MAHDTYPRWTAHPSRALHDTRWRHTRHARRAETTSWITMAVGFVYGLVGAGLILATIAVVGLIAYQPQALTTWLAVVTVVVPAGLAVGAIARRLRHPGG